MPSAESNTISIGLAPHAHRPLESGPRAAPLTPRAGSHPSHERCGMVSHGVFVRNIIMLLPRFCDTGPNSWRPDVSTACSGPHGLHHNGTNRSPHLRSRCSRWLTWWGRVRRTEKRCSSGDSRSRMFGSTAKSRRRKRCACPDTSVSSSGSSDPGQMPAGF